VHIVLPEREAFSRHAPEPTASVLVTMKGGYRLTETQALAVRSLVSGAVPKLRPEAVTVLDPNGPVLAADDGSASAQLGKIEDLKREREARVQREVQTMLAPLVGGWDKVRVTVAAEVSRDREVVTERSFDPTSQVARSTQTVNTSEKSSERKPLNDGVTVANNTPNDGNRGPAATSQSEKARLEETVNYELSSKVRELVREAGDIRRITVSVLVDGTWSKGQDGKPVFTERAPDEIKRIEKLVRDAVGYSDKRGDSVTVESMKFSGGDPVDVFAPGFLEANLMELIQLAVVLLVVILLLVFVARPLIARQTAEDEEDESAETAPESEAKADEGALEPDEMVDVERIEGRMKASTLRQMSDLINGHPDEVTAIMRTWINENGED